MLLDLSEQEVWQAVAMYLPPKDVLSFLSVHQNINKFLSASPTFWSQLLVRDQDYEETFESESTIVAAADIRQAFMLQSFCRVYPL